jgi:hypothetical protein
LWRRIGDEAGSGGCRGGMGLVGQLSERGVTLP